VHRLDHQGVVRRSQHSVRTIVEVDHRAALTGEEQQSGDWPLLVFVLRVVNRVAHEQVAHAVAVDVPRARTKLELRSAAGHRLERAETPISLLSRADQGKPYLAR